MWMIVTMRGMNNVKHVKVHKVYESVCHTLSSEPYEIVFIWGSFRKVGNLQYDTKNCMRQDPKITRIIFLKWFIRFYTITTLVSFKVLSF